MYKHSTIYIYRERERERQRERNIHIYIYTYIHIYIYIYIYTMFYTTPLGTFSAGYHRLLFAGLQNRIFNGFHHVPPRPWRSQFLNLASPPEALQKVMMFVSSSAILEPDTPRTTVEQPTRPVFDRFGQNIFDWFDSFGARRQRRQPFK